MGAVITILYDKVDFARRQFLTRRLLDSKPAGYRLLTGSSDVIETPLAGSVRTDNNSFTTFIPSQDQEFSYIIKCHNDIGTTPLSLVTTLVLNAWCCSCYFSADNVLLATLLAPIDILLLHEPIARL